MYNVLSKADRYNEWRKNLHIIFIQSLFTRYMLTGTTLHAYTLLIYFKSQKHNKVLNSVTDEVIYTVNHTIN